jgi:hypothetical protein
MVVHRFNDHIREDLARIAGLMAPAAKSGTPEKEPGGDTRLATAR